MIRLFRPLQITDGVTDNGVPGDAHSSIQCHPGIEASSSASITTIVVAARAISASSMPRMLPGVPLITPDSAGWTATVSARLIVFSRKGVCQERMVSDPPDSILLGSEFPEMANGPIRPSNLNTPDSALLHRRQYCSQLAHRASIFPLARSELRRPSATINADLHVLFPARAKKRGGLLPPRVALPILGGEGATSNTKKNPEGDLRPNWSRRTTRRRIAANFAKLPELLLLNRTNFNSITSCACAIVCGHQFNTRLSQFGRDSSSE